MFGSIKQLTDQYIIQIIQFTPHTSKTKQKQANKQTKEKTKTRYIFIVSINK